MKHENNYYNEEKKRPVSTSAVVRLAIWAVVFCLLSAVFAAAMLSESGLGGLWFIRDFDDEDYHVGNGTIKETVHEISIEWVAGSVTLQYTDGDEITVTEDYNGDKDAHRMRWQVEDGELSVKFCRGKISLDAAESKNLTVEIPRSAVRPEEISVTTVSGSQNIRVSAQELEIDSVSGAVSVEGDYETVDAETVSGDLHFEGSFRRGAADGVSADVTLRLTRQASDLELNTVSGHVRVILPADTAGFTVDADSLGGDVDVKGFSFDHTSTNRWGDGSMTVRFDGVSGKLTMEGEAEN